MKRLILILSILMLLLAGCTQKEKNITFKAVIESLAENNMMVATTDDVGFDKASVFTNEAEIDFEPSIGDQVEITILPEIRESYPVQVTAVKITLIAKGAPQSTQTDYIKISPEEAKVMIDGETVLILDVRTQAEYDEGHIENAILLPNTEILNLAASLLPDKNEKILVYCRSGNRSAQASKALLEMGYTQVFDFGGIMNWPYDVVKD